MSRKARILLLTPVLGIVAVLVVGVLVIKSDFASRRLCAMITDGLTGATGLRASIESCRMDILPPAVEAAGVQIQDTSGGRLLEVDGIQVELDALALMTGRFSIKRLALSRPHVHLTYAQGALLNLPPIASREPESGQPGAPARSTGASLVQQVEVKGGRLDLSAPELGLLQIDRFDLSVHLAKDDGIRVQAVFGDGRLDLIGGQGDSVALTGMRASVVWKDRLLDVAHLSLKAGELEVAMSGQVADPAGDLQPHLELSLGVPLAWLHIFLPQVPPMQGKAVVTAKAEPGPAGPRAHGSLDVKGCGIATVRDVDLQSHFEIDPKSVRLSDMRITTPAGSISGGLSLQLESPLGFSGKIQLNDIDLYRGLAMGGLDVRQVGATIQGPVQFEGRFIAPTGPFVITETDFELQRLRLLPEPEGDSGLLKISRAGLKAEAVFNGREVRLPSFRLELGATALIGDGRIGWQRASVSSRIRIPELVLSDLSPLAGQSVSGTGGVGVEVSGAFPLPRLNIDSELADLVVNEVPVGTVFAELSLDADKIQVKQMQLARGGSSISLSGTFGMNPSHAIRANIALDRIAVKDLATAIAGPAAPRGLKGLLTGQVTAGGDLVRPIVDFRMGFNGLEYAGQMFEEGGAVGQYANGIFRLDLLEVRMGPGWWFANGSISADGQLDLTGYSTGLRLVSFRPLWPLREQLDFRLDAHMAIRGPLRSPALDGWLKTYDTVFAGHRLADSFVSTQVTTEAVRLQGMFLGKAAVLEGDIQLQGGLPFSANLLFGSDQLGRFLPPMSGRTWAALNGQLNVTGKLLQPETLEAGLAIDRIALNWAGLELHNEDPISLRLEHGDVRVEKCTLAGTQTRLQLKGGGSLAAGPRLNLEGQLGLGLLPLLTRHVPRANGLANIRLDVSGSWARPRLAGSAAFSASRVRVAFLPGDLINTTGQLRFSPERVSILGVRGEWNGGNFSTQGGLSFKDAAPELNLSIDVDRVRYEVSSSLWGVVSGSANLGGAIGQRLDLSGELRVSEGLYEDSRPLASLSQGLFRPKVTQVRTYSRERESVGFDLRLIVPEKFQVVYDFDIVKFQAEMRGDLRLSGTNERLGLVGEAESLQGTVGYLSKDFELQSARVRFPEKYAIAPRFDVQAVRQETVERADEAEVAYQIVLRLSGDPERIQANLSSNPSLDEADIITLLTLGITSRDVATLKQEDLLNVGGQVLASSFRLDQRLNRLFPFPKEFIQAKYFRLRSRFSRDTGRTTPHLEAGVKLRFISENLDLDMSQSLQDHIEQSLDLTYRLSPDLSGRLRLENTSELFDGGVDFKFNWEW